MPYKPNTKKRKPITPGMTPEDIGADVAEYIRTEVQDKMANSMEIFGFYKIIDLCDLTPDQKDWAKHNLDWKVVIL